MPAPAARTVLGPRLQAHEARIVGGFPAPVHEVLRAGVLRLADWQDEAYATDYLDRLEAVCVLDAHTRARGGEPSQGRLAGEPPHALLAETARHLALWMSYEDTIRVADLKTRRSRFERVAAEVRVGEGQLLEIGEFLHPRIEEVADTLPAGLGRWLLGSPRARALVWGASRARVGGAHQLDPRLRDAVRGRRPAPPAPAVLAALRRRDGADGDGSRGSRRPRRATPRSRSRSRAASGWSRATATRTRAAGAASSG